MSENQTIVARSMGFTTWLTLMFVAAKLTQTIDWSWWWVFSPVIASIGLSMALLFFIAIVLIIIAVVS